MKVEMFCAHEGEIGSEGLITECVQLQVLTEMRFPGFLQNVLISI